MTDILRPPFPSVWDNTMRSDFAACPRKFFWRHLRHFTPFGTSTDLHAGKAWADGLETLRRAFYEEGRPEIEAHALAWKQITLSYGDFEPPPHKTNKSLSRLHEALNYYIGAFPLERDHCKPFIGASGKPMIEFSFAAPLDSALVTPDTGDPIIYAGRADMVATYAGALSIFDDKTTGSLGATWAEQWDRRAQFTGYAWAAREANIPVTQVIVRGIALLKTSINHAEAIVPRPPHHINEWHYQFCRDVSRAISLWKEGYWDVNLSDACSAYGGCAFKGPCMSHDPEPWLSSNFLQRHWDPITRTETILHDPTKGPTL